MKFICIYPDKCVSFRTEVGKGRKRSLVCIRGEFRMQEIMIWRNCLHGLTKFVVWDKISKLSGDGGEPAALA